MARSCLSYRLDRVIDFRQRSLIICDLTLRDLGHVEESEMVRLSMHEAKVTVPQLIPPPCWRYAMLQQCKYYKWLANCCVWNYTTTAAAIEFTVRESRWHENFPDFFLSALLARYSFTLCMPPTWRRGFVAGHNDVATPHLPLT